MRGGGEEWRCGWWALATVLGAVALAMGMTMTAAGGEGGVRTTLMLAAMICLPTGLAAAMAGVGLMWSRRRRPLAMQLLGYAAALGLAVVAAVLAWVLTMPAG